MFPSLVRLAVVGRPGWIASGFVVGMLSLGTVQAAQPAPAAQAADPNAMPCSLAADGALVLNYIKADKTEDFEEVVGKVREALTKSEKPERKAQAAGWKIYKAAEPGPQGSVLYVWVVDPVAKGSEY